MIPMSYTRSIKLVVNFPIKKRDYTRSMIDYFLIETA